jgi:hypothetical protein
MLTPAILANTVVGVVIVMHRQSDLLQITPALSPPRRLTRLLHRRQQQGKQERNDRNHDEQFNECEAIRRRAANDSLMVHGSNSFDEDIRLRAIQYPNKSGLGDLVRG